MKTFGSKVIRLFSGHIIAQIINLATVPVITRFYGPAEFGYFSTFLSIALVVSPICSLRMAQFVVLPKKDSDTGDVICLAGTTLFVLGICVLTLAIWVGAKFISFGNVGVPEDFIWFLPLVVFLIGANDIAMSWNLRNDSYSVMSISKVLEVVVDRVLGIGAGIYLGLGGIGLVFSRTAGLAISLLFSVGAGNAEKLIHSVRSSSVKGVAASLTHYGPNAAYLSVASLASSASREMPAVIIAFTYGIVPAGYYALCLRILNLPIMMFGDAVARVNYRTVVDLQNDNEAIRLHIFVTLKYMFYAAFPLVIVIAFNGPAIFAFVFGSNWSDAGMFAQLLVFGIVFTFLHKIPSALFDTFLLNRARLVFELILLSLRILSLFIAFSLSLSITFALILLLLSTILVITASTVYLFRLIQSSPAELARFIGIQIFRFLPLLACVPCITYLSEGNSITLVLVEYTIVFASQLAFLIFCDADFKDYVMRTYNARRRL